MLRHLCKIETRTICLPAYEGFVLTHTASYSSNVLTPPGHEFQARQTREPAQCPHRVVVRSLVVLLAWARLYVVSRVC